MDEEANARDTIRFRPSKKRKTYRSRPDEEDQAPSQPLSEAVADDDDDNASSVTAALRARNARKRLGGVGFTLNGKIQDDTPISRALVPFSEQEESRQLQGISDRFTHQTGRLHDLNDKHMNEYIASRLSTRAQGEASSSMQIDTPSEQLITKETQPQAITHGELLEVAIPIAPSINHDRALQIPARQKKVRLGPDGKPWRGRKRRGSEDIKRDQLVEDILRENRLDVYEVPATSEPASGADGEADERLAEEFRKQYMDDVAKKQQKKKKPTQPVKGSAEEALKGPKLGGSRNARSAVRDALLKKEKEGKK